MVAGHQQQNVYYFHLFSFPSTTLSVKHRHVGPFVAASPPILRLLGGVHRCPGPERPVNHTWGLFSPKRVT